MGKQRMPAWHGEDWVEVLRQTDERIGRRETARRIGYSPATVHTVLNGTYRADPARVQRAVIENLSGAEVECPVLGRIPLVECAQHRARPFASTNPQRVRLYRACRACPHNPDREDA